jgi:hypothetical protein
MALISVTCYYMVISSVQFVTKVKAQKKKITFLNEISFFSADKMRGTDMVVLQNYFLISNLRSAIGQLPL